MESVCICGPSPMRINGWKIIRYLHNNKMKLVNEKTGETIKGHSAGVWMRFMCAIGIPVEILDRRAWVWHIRGADGEIIGSYPDPRPYPYPESARR
jgi:hypothetical protein